LTYWLVLAGYQVAGIRELGVRLPGALAAAGTILFAYGMGRLLFSIPAGLLAAIFTATGLRVFIIARKLPIDVLLLFWLTGAAFFFVRGMLKESRRSILLAYLFTALGFMTKGPISPAIAGISCALWSLWAGRLRARLLHPVAGLLIFAAVSVPWYLWTYFHHGWTYIYSFFLEDNLARYVTQIRGPVRGPFYYFPVFLSDFFPWSILALAALIHIWKQWKSLRSQKGLAYGFPLLWCAVTFLIFSISKNKQEYYIVPLYPLMAVLLAGALDGSLMAKETAQGSTGPPWRAVLMAVGIIFLALAVLFPLVLPSLIPDAPAVLHYAPAVISFLAAAIIAYQALRRRYLRSLTVTAATMWLIFVLAGTAYLPALEPQRPVKAICRAIGEEAQPGDQAGYYRAAVPSMAFYLQRQIFAVSNPPMMADKFRESVRVFCVMGNRDYRYFKDECGLELYVLHRYQQLPTQLRIMLGKESPTGEGDELLLISNRPARGTGHPGQRDNP
jgi:4-amino-4-deoxy-L-arabinose transferase-like glycosyltransferase